MKHTLLMLIMVVSLMAGGPHRVTNFESADLNNHGGPVVEDSTDIIQVDFTEYYISFRGVDVGESHKVFNYVADGLDATFDIEGHKKAFYTFNTKLIVVDIEQDKISIYFF